MFLYISFKTAAGGTHCAAIYVISAQRAPGENLINFIFAFILHPRKHISVFDIFFILIKDSIPFIIARSDCFLSSQCIPVSSGKRSHRVAYIAAGIGFAEDISRLVNLRPACRMHHVIVRHKQTVQILVSHCGFVRSFHLRGKTVGIDRSYIGKRNIVQALIRYWNCAGRISSIDRTRYSRARKVEIIGRTRA